MFLAGAKNHMANISRLTGLAVSVFTLEGNYIDDLEDATVTVNVDSEEAKAIKDQFAYPWATGRSWQLECGVFVSTSATLVALAATGDAQVSISFDTGGNAYSGIGLIKTASHSVGKGALQRQKVTIDGQGPLGIA
jgi:hypothetical protein